MDKQTEILAFYRSQEQRLSGQLKLLEQNAFARAAIINRELAAGPEIRRILVSHGIPDGVVSRCKFTGSPKGIVVEFPREQPGTRGRTGKRPPFSAPANSEKAQVFRKADGMVAEAARKVLDNQG